jgi:hypothetical protein
MLLLVSFVYALDVAEQLPDPDEDVQRAGCSAAYIVSYAASPKRTYENEPVTFYVNATSTNAGATLDITIYFDYLLANGSLNPSSPSFYTQALAPASIVTTHAYDHIGNLSDIDGYYFRVRFIVNDGGTTPYESTLKVYVGNTAPWLYSKPYSTIFPTYELPYTASYIVMDHDNELVTATWDFGDGTEPVVNETTAGEEGSFISQTHTWVVEPLPGIDKDDGYYILANMSVRFEDAYGHTIYSNHTVNITPPENLQPARTFSALSATWSPGYELPFYASATDPEGDPITWTHVFNDGTEDYLTSVHHTDYTAANTTVWYNVTHTFPSTGEYYVTLFVSDALEPWQATNNLSWTVKITIVDNAPPGVLDTIVISPTSPRINTTLGYAEVLLSVQAYDYDADILYLTWDFGDGETATNQSAGGSIESIWFFQVHRYTVAGQYNATVVVDDGRGHTKMAYRVFNVTSSNVPPALRSLTIARSNGTYAAPGTPVNVTVVLYDSERDPLTIWIDFGDNSSIVMIILTDFSENGTVTCALSHVYNSTGLYTVRIAYTDGVFGAGHNVSVDASVEVKVPRVVVPRVWNWWDTVSLSLVFIGVGLIFARWYVLGRFRSDLDRKGLSYEEYRTIIAELRMERNVSLKNVDAQVAANKIDGDSADQAKARIRKTYAEKVSALKAGTLASMTDKV